MNRGYDGNGIFPGKEIDTGTFEGKRQRGDLLVQLKDRAD